MYALAYGREVVVADPPEKDKSAGWTVTVEQEESTID